MHPCAPDRQQAQQDGDCVAKGGCLAHPPLQQLKHRLQGGQRLRLVARVAGQLQVGVHHEQDAGQVVVVQQLQSRVGGRGAESSERMHQPEALKQRLWRRADATLTAVGGGQGKEEGEHWQDRGLCGRAG
jgi:hypothetical protein